MSKGRKFDAAEKHFMGQITKLNKRISQLEGELSQAHIANIDLKVENAMLKNEIASLNDWIQRLLEYTELSKDEIKVACENEEKASRMFKTMEAILGNPYLTRYR